MLECQKFSALDPEIPGFSRKACEIINSPIPPSLLAAQGNNN